MELNMDELQRRTMAAATSILEPQGYRLSKTVKTCFEKRGGEISNSIQFEFKARSSFARCSKQLITFHRVENIIMEIDLPNRDLSLAGKGSVLISTIEDKLSSFDYDQEKQVLTEDDGKRWHTAVLKYLINEGASFTERYHDLNAVLKKMDELKDERKEWIELLSGGPDHFFRGLIISRLCNDPKFQNKIAEGDREFVKTMGDIWAPYYVRLKAKLNSLTV